jgi:hypothetical protein
LQQISILINIKTTTQSKKKKPYLCTPNNYFLTIVDAGSVMVMLSGTTNLVAFRPDWKSYMEQARVKVSESPVYAHPVLSGNRIFVREADYMSNVDS